MVYLAGPAERAVHKLAVVTDRLPLFPLGSVLFPGLVMPLHIFEARYRKLVEDLLTVPGEARRFGVVAIRAGREVGSAGVQALYGVGCVAELRQAQRHEDGRYDIVGVGGARFRLDVLHPAAEGDYLTGDVTELSEADGDGLDEAVVATAAAFTRYQAALVGLRGEPVVSGELPDDPRLLSYLIAAAVVVPFPERQRFLEAPDTATRLRLALATITRELTAIAALPSLPATDITTAGWSPN